MIGVFGGTFAPIHNGHLRLAIEARTQLGASEIRLIPAACPPLRTPPGVAAERRLRWVQLAIAGEDGLRADDRELKRPGPSYTVDTLAELRAEHPTTPLCLLLGQDAARRLPEWHRWETLRDFAHLVFFSRTGEAPEFPAPLTQHLHGHRAHSVAHLHQDPCGLWWRCDLPPLDISATRIRQRIKAGQSIRGLVPDAVIRDFTPHDLEILTRNETPSAA